MPRGASERIVLDTSAYSAFRSGREDVLGILSTCASVIVPTVVIGELEAGFRSGSRTRENMLTLEEFLDEPFVSVVSVDRAVSRHYGRIFSRLRREGTPIPMNDVWIAACSLSCDATLLTLDSDFEKVAGLSRLVLSA